MSRSLIPNSTQIPDVILDHWMGHLSGAEFKVVMYIARRTYGFGKDSDTISLNQLARGIRMRRGGQLDYGTGLSRSSVKSACASLVGRGVLVKTQATVAGSDEPDENTYRLNLYAPVILEGVPEQEQPTSSDQETGVGQKITHVGQKSAYLHKESEVGQKLAQGRSKNSQGVGQKLAPQETAEQETVLQETAAADIAPVERPKSRQRAKGIAAAELNKEKAQDSSPADPALIASLIAADLNRADAERLARTRPDECRRQLAYLPFKTDLDNPGGYLRRAIEGGFPPPKEHKAAQAKEERERKKREEAEHRKALEAAQKAQEAAEALRVDEYIGRIEKEAPETFAGFLRYVERKRSEVRAKFQNMTPSIRARMLADLDTPEKRRELFTQWQALPRQEPDTRGEWQQLSILDTSLQGNRNGSAGNQEEAEETADEESDRASIAHLIQVSLRARRG